MNHAEKTSIPKCREALICELHRLEFEIEAADCGNDYASAHQVRSRYHSTMAELHAIAADRHRERRGEFLWARRDHLRLAKLARADTTKQEGQRV